MGRGTGGGGGGGGGVCVCGGHKLFCRVYGGLGKNIWLDGCVCVWGGGGGRGS